MGEWGTAETPQFPTISKVIPALLLLSGKTAENGQVSEWV